MDGPVGTLGRMKRPLMRALAPKVMVTTPLVTIAGAVRMMGVITPPVRPTMSTAL